MFQKLSGADNSDKIELHQNQTVYFLYLLLFEITKDLKLERQKY